ncbi:pyridoxamine 5'-phosphate oxidase family protein [Nocardioides sp.]|uniref:pyridoxamine 5'-phosphate oxidase family protein n=1 Tax=Nocardioides sp. TaxID=35761 RepID=UPI002CD3F81E|nr:pyridoxamine 5'-phosphate oxidase family protein [Nocardioides sp.]HXH80196.1 pyridoxamine 5'-phosphate oxidase family protein [Nocardioides sp.]
MKQRDVIVMDEAEIDQFLTAQRSSTVATLGPQGQIHLVGMWFAWFDGHIWLETKAKSQKVRNLRRNDRMTFLVEAGHTYDSLRGVSLEGRGVIIEDDPELLERVCLQIFERYHSPYTPELRPFLELMMNNRIVVRLDIERTRSWDHRKLGLPAMELGGSTAPSTQET